MINPEQCQIRCRRVHDDLYAELSIDPELQPSCPDLEISGQLVYQLYYDLLYRAGFLE